MEIPAFSRKFRRFGFRLIRCHKISFHTLHLQGMSTEKKLLLSSDALAVTLNRLCAELIEIHEDFSNTVMIGLQPRGTFLAKRIAFLLESRYKLNGVQLGFLDSTFFRDDFRRREQPIIANQTRIDFLVEGKKVIFIDDVLYTGRSVRAALDAIHSFGRPEIIELLCLIDRKFTRHLPIQPNYTGRQVEAIRSERVLVNWEEESGADAVYLIKSKQI
jgi:pyrimidine operon attenuation protein / uracil phosphoribosyltransferase